MAYVLGNLDYLFDKAPVFNSTYGGFVQQCEDELEDDEDRFDPDISDWEDDG